MLLRLTYTVFLSWRRSFEENSQRTSKKARFGGGYSGPLGFWYLKVNSIPSLNTAKIFVRDRMKMMSIWCLMSNNSNVKEKLLVQCGHSLSGLDLVQAKGEGKATGQFLNTTHMRWGPVQVRPLILDQLIKELKNRKITGLVELSIINDNADIMWILCCHLTCCKLRMSVLAQSILSVCLVLLRVSLMMSP